MGGGQGWPVRWRDSEHGGRNGGRNGAQNGALGPTGVRILGPGAKPEILSLRLSGDVPET